MSRLNRALMLAATAVALAGSAAPAQQLDEPGGKFRLPGLESAPVERFSAKAIVSDETATPGRSLHAAVELTIAPDLWLYGPIPGGKVVLPIALKVQTGQTKLRVGEVLFSPTMEHKTSYPDGKVDVHNVYEGKGYLFIPVTVPTDAAPGRYEIPVRIDGQVCELSGRCILVGQDVSASVEIGPATAPSPNWTPQLQEALSQSRTAREWAAALRAAAEPPTPLPPAQRPGAGLTVLAGLAAALLAGLTLNIMPCVLPVIPLRLFALLEYARRSRQRFLTLGLAFAGGIVLFFLALAVANIALKLALQYTLKWGDLFRHPEAVIVMALFLVALAANMFGAFTVTVPGRLAGAEAGGGHAGAVGTGFIMAVLSTPCSFAILAAAFGWAQAQPLWLGTVGILFIGLGMAAPHAVLAGFPQAVRKIPPAGRWTELFRQSVGFVLLLVAAWLLGTHMTEPYWARVVAYAVVVAMCLWVWGSWVGHDTPARRKWAVRAGALAVAALAGWWMLSPSRPSRVVMRPFDAAEIARARAEGKTVLVKFTASWCLECKLLEMRIYDSADVARMLQDRGVAAFVGDVTRRGAPAGEMLYGQLGQSGPPVTAVFPPRAGPPVLLIGSFSQDDLLKALEAAGNTLRSAGGSV